MRVVVVGGGAAGLSAAYHLAQRSKNGSSPLEIIGIEASRRLGGKICTEKVGSLCVEAGPDSFVTLKPQALRLVRELGLSGRLLTTNREHKDVYVYVRGRLRRLPEGLLLMAPSRILPFLFSDIMSWRGKLRMGLDFFLPPCRDENISIGAFTRRRFGREALHSIVQPVMGGILSGDAETLSLRHTFPKFLEYERSHGSVIRGLMSSKRAHCGFPKSSGPETAETRPLTMFVTLSGGLSTLVEALQTRLEPGAFRLGCKASGILRQGDGWKVLLENGQPLDCDGMVLASPSRETSKMVASLDTELSCALSEIPCTSSATVSLAYEAPRRPNLPPGFGLVVARGETRVISAVSFTSSKFPGSAPEGTTLIRCFLGGAGRESELDACDEDLLSAMRVDLKRLLGVSTEPSMLRLYRWPDANPQYTVGHADRLQRIHARLRLHPGILLAGASYNGVGVPDCVDSGAQAADSLYNFCSTRRR